MAFCGSVHSTNMPMICAGDTISWSSSRSRVATASCSNIGIEIYPRRCEHQRSESAQKDRSTYLAHPLLVHARRITIHGEEIRQTLSQLLILGRIGREIGHHETLEDLSRARASSTPPRVSEPETEADGDTHPFVRNHARQYELGESDAQQCLDLFRVFPVEDV